MRIPRIKPRERASEAEVDEGIPTWWPLADHRQLSPTPHASVEQPRISVAAVETPASASAPDRVARLETTGGNPTPPFGEASLSNPITDPIPVVTPDLIRPSISVAVVETLPSAPWAAPQQRASVAAVETLPSVEERAARLETTVANVPLIELRDVTRSFPGDPEVQALKAVSLTVHKGEYISVVGHSGSGKSTMLNILGLLDRPTVGEYRIDGHLTGSLTETERAAVRALRIGFVFQAFHLMPRRTVLNNVLMPMAYAGVPRAERHDRAVEALERVGLSHRMNFLPGTLSGGERQRVAIARAVATRPSLLLADEPTGNLDQATANSVMDLFDELNADGLTLMVITHDSTVAARARRTLRINDGRVTEAGILLPELEVAA